MERHRRLLRILQKTIPAYGEPPAGAGETGQTAWPATCAGILRRASRPVSLYIITFNDADNLRAALPTVAWANEVGEVFFA